MGRSSTLVRFYAVLAMLATGGDATKALPIFKACAKTEATVEGKDFLGRWWQRYLNCKPGENFLADKHRDGRPPRIDDVEAKKCAARFKDKVAVHGKRRHYKSVEEVGTWQLAAANRRDFRLSASHFTRADYPRIYNSMSTPVTLHAGLQEESIP
jgi:hypothetical protein